MGNLSEPEADRILDEGGEPEYECAICGEFWPHRSDLDGIGICEPCRYAEATEAERAHEAQQALIDIQEDR